MTSLDSFFHFIYFSVTLTQIEHILQGYRGFGPIVGILLPMIEAILPFLPLVVIVLANAAGYGFLLGFLYSWLGSSLGSILVFLVFRKIAKNAIKNRFTSHKKLQGMFVWVEKKGFGPLFFIFCFPFTPSALINVVAGLANVGILQFVMAVLLGKMILIGIITYLGNGWESIILHPTMLIPILIIVIALWFIGRSIEKRMANTSENRGKDKERVNQ